MRRAIKDYILGIAKKSQIAVNLLTNTLAMGVSMLISLWMTPYLIQKMGFAAFGYIGLIANLIGFMAVLTYALNSMAGRFLAVSLRQGGPEKASRYISSALFSNVCAGILILALILVLTLNMGQLIRIQAGLAKDVRIAFVLSGIAFILSSIAIIFATAAYTGNRLDITNGINIFTNIVRALFLVVAYTFFNARIWYYAMGSVLQVSINIILAMIAFRSLLPDVHFSIKMFDLKMSLELLSSGFFNSLIMLGTVFMTQIDLIVGNRYLPAEIVGMYAAILLIPNSIRNIAVALSSAFSPTTLILYSSGDLQSLRKYSNKVVKFCGFMLGWPVAVVSGLGVAILKLWLGKDYSDYEFTIILMLLPLSANLAVRQLYNVQEAMNKVKIPAFISILSGITNLALAIALTVVLKMGIFGIVLSGAIISTVHALVFNPIYTAIITNQPKHAYYRGLISPLLVSLITCTMGILIQKFMTVNTFSSILYSAFGLSILYFVISISLLSHEERKLISQKGNAILRRQVA
jgi:membrane protein EpsK